MKDVGSEALDQNYHQPENDIFKYDVRGVGSQMLTFC